jgi:hypothetical protein
MLMETASEGLVFDCPQASGEVQCPRFTPAIRRQMTTDADRLRAFAYAIGAGEGIYRQAAIVDQCRLKIGSAG